MKKERSGLSAIEFHLDQISDLIRKANLVKNQAHFLYKNNLRTPLFMLEAIFRAYRDVYKGYGYKKMYSRVKEVEDAVGRLDYYYYYANEMAANKSKARVRKYLLEKAKRMEDELKEILSNEGWLDGSVIRKIRKKLTKTVWKTQEDEAAEIRDFYIKAIGSLPKSSRSKEIIFRDMELDVHELRRDLRWLSIYPHAFQGLFQISRTKQKPGGNLLKYRTKEIIRSPFIELPQRFDYPQNIWLNKNNFIALSWIIAEIGSLKDNGLRLEIVGEAMEQTGKSPGKIREQEVISFLGKKQDDTKTILKKAADTYRQFLKDKVLDNLVAGD